MAHTARRSSRFPAWVAVDHEMQNRLSGRSPGVSAAAPVAGAAVEDAVARTCL